jgi:hypothetical protein
MVLSYVHDRSSGHVVPSAAAHEENAKWDRIEQSLANEARVVDSHIASSKAQSPRAGGGAVVAATVIGGPWVGLFVALRNLHKR